MPALRDVRVDFVSLVDRASLRDPENESEPNRFLLRKSESRDDLKAAIRDEIATIETVSDDTAPATTPPRKDPIHMAEEAPTTDTTPTEPSDVRAAAAECLVTLSAYSDQVDPDILTALAQLSQLGLDGTEGEGVAEKTETVLAKIARAEEGVLRVAKQEDRATLHAAVKRARAEVEAEYLAAIR